MNTEQPEIVADNLNRLTKYVEEVCQHFVFQTNTTETRERIKQTLINALPPIFPAHYSIDVKPGTWKSQFPNFKLRLRERCRYVFVYLLFGKAQAQKLHPSNIMLVNVVYAPSRIVDDLQVNVETTKALT